MVAIKDMEMPKNCVECNHMDLQQAINCQLIYSGCANCGRHPNCPLVEIGTCKDCYNAVKNLPPANVVEHSKIDKAIEVFRKEIEENRLNVIDYAEGEWIVKDFVYGAIERFKRNIGE